MANGGARARAAASRLGVDDGAAPNPPCGLTIASENPVYIQGDFNAPGGNLAAANTVATSVAADAVTLLSDNFNDVKEKDILECYDVEEIKQKL